MTSTLSSRPLARAAASVASSSPWTAPQPERGGHLQVATECDGAVAVERAINERPDVILMDVAMSGVDGLQALAALRAHPTTCAIPVVFLTGYVTVREVEALVAAGVVVANSGPGALRWIRAGHRFDVILCELHLPSLSGESLFATLSTEQPEQAQRVAFLASGPTTPSEERFLTQMNGRVLWKPFGYNDLQAFLAARLTESGRRLEVEATPTLASGRPSGSVEK